MTDPPKPKTDPPKPNTVTEPKTEPYEPKTDISKPKTRRRLRKASTAPEKPQRPDNTSYAKFLQIKALTVPENSESVRKSKTPNNDHKMLSPIIDLSENTDSTLPYTLGTQNNIKNSHLSDRLNKELRSAVKAVVEPKPEITCIEQPDASPELVACPVDINIIDTPFDYSEVTPEGSSDSITPRARNASFKAACRGFELVFGSKGLSKTYIKLQRPHTGDIPSFTATLV